MPFKLPGRNKYFKRSKPDLEILCEKIIEVRKRSELIMLVPMPTGNSWRGIYNGAMAFAPDYFLALPQYYSQTIYSETELERLCSALIAAKFSRIIFSGVPAYFSKLINHIHQRRQKKEVRIMVIYHGSLSSNREDSANIEELKAIVDLHQSGKIDCIGFIKKGMMETFSRLRKINCHHLIPMTSLKTISAIERKEWNDTLQIGIFTHNSFRKNIDNQIAAALMFENSSVHTHEDFQFNYLNQQNRVEFHPFIESYSDFLSLISEMTFNFYVTFSECFGLFIAESLALGVPCLAADNSGIFDYNTYLHDALIVKEFDNSDAIYKKARSILQNRDEIATRGIEYINELNLIAQRKFVQFLES